jgi:hypothetical protein
MTRIGGGHVPAPGGELPDAARAAAQQATPQAAVVRGGPRGVVIPTGVESPLGVGPCSREELAEREAALLSRSVRAAASFPEETRAAVTEALKTSAARVLGALDAGRIDAAEASEALEMLREMLEALDDLRAGRAEVVDVREAGANVRTWELRAPDGDEFTVTTRLRLDEFGEARVGMRHTVDDGVKLTRSDRMSMRVDLERYGRPSVDVQFGSPGLDKRIHGLYKNEDGSVFRTERGKKLADHHFRDHLPEALAKPAHFEAMVTAFREGIMAPFAATAQETRS